MRRVVSSLAAASAAGNGSRPPAPNDARAPAVAWHTPGVGVVRRIARQKPLRPAPALLAKVPAMQVRAKGVQGG